MDSSANPIAALVGILLLFFVGRFLVYLARTRQALWHALSSIPLPRHSTLVSGEPSTQIEAVLLDVFDTEYRRTVESEPRYEQYSAEEVAELRVFLFQRAFSRRAPRILYEIEVGVPLYRKFQERDPVVCEWALKRLEANPPLFGEPDTIDDLVLKPSRFRQFLWMHGVGSSPVLFLEDVFRALPITIVPRALRPACPGPVVVASADGGDERRPGMKDQPDNAAAASEHLRELVGTLDEGVLGTLGTGNDAEVETAIAGARASVLKASTAPHPQVIREFLERLDGYEERLASFEAAFAAETSRPMDDWAPWVREALAAATAGGNLAELGEDAVLERFRRRARRLWVTSSTDVTTARDSSIATRPGWSEAEADEADETTSEVSDEMTDEAPESPVRSPEQHTDKGSEIGF